jgi:hypothetical protein
MDTHSRSPTNMLHKTSDKQHARRTRQMAFERIGWISGFAKPPLTPLTPTSFKQWFVQHNPQLPLILSLNKYKSWSLKLNSIHPCYLLLMNNVPMHHTSFKIFEKWHVHNIFKIEACIKFIPYTYTYAYGKIF